MCPASTSSPPTSGRTTRRRPSRSPTATSVVTATVVGRLPRSAFYTSEVWIHPDGKHVYLGTTLGGDRIYAIDISDPAKPVITDSIMANSRSMNDLMTTADGKWLVFTREGAADRRNGIVIASTEDPAHPKPVAEFTEGVTAGVHSAFVYTQPRYGTHVYLTNSGTGSLNIVDINDPLKPRLVSAWQPKEISAGRALHDIDVKDGIAYVSYWSDGLVILDVGNGMKGGTPAAPKLISNYRYNAEKLYPGATADYGPGFHQRHAHGVATQELRVHRRRGVPAVRADGHVGCQRRSAPTAGCRWWT